MRDKKTYIIDIEGLYMDTVKRTMINFELNPILLERFDNVNNVKGLKRSEVLRRLMDDYIEKNSMIQLKT